MYDGGGRKEGDEDQGKVSRAASKQAESKSKSNAAEFRLFAKTFLSRFPVYLWISRWNRLLMVDCMLQLVRV